MGPTSCLFFRLLPWQNSLTIQFSLWAWMRPLGIAGGLGHPGPDSDLLVTWLAIDPYLQAPGFSPARLVGWHMTCRVPPHHHDIQTPSNTIRTYRSLTRGEGGYPARLLCPLPHGCDQLSFNQLKFKYRAHCTPPTPTSILHPRQRFYSVSQKLSPEKSELVT